MGLKLRFDVCLMGKGVDVVGHWLVEMLWRPVFIYMIKLP